MSASIAPLPTHALDDAWLEDCGLNAVDVAQAQAHMHAAERIVDTLFALAEGLHFGPGRLAHAPASGTAHIRNV